MQDPVVAQHLDVAGTEFHRQMDRRVVGQAVEEVERLLLHRAEPRHFRHELRLADGAAHIAGDHVTGAGRGDRHAVVGL